MTDVFYVTNAGACCCGSGSSSGSSSSSSGSSSSSASGSGEPCFNLDNLALCCPGDVPFPLTATMTWIPLFGNGPGTCTGPVICTLSCSGASCTTRLDDNFSFTLYLFNDPPGGCNYYSTGTSQPSPGGCCSCIGDCTPAPYVGVVVDCGGGDTPSGHLQLSGLCGGPCFGGFGRGGGATIIDPADVFSCGPLYCEWTYYDYDDSFAIVPAIKIILST